MTNSNEDHVECAFCGGQGKPILSPSGSFEEQNSCPVCNGKGTLLIDTEKSPLVKCSRCNGHGYYPINVLIGSTLALRATICHICGGSGYQAGIGQ